MSFYLMQKSVYLIARRYDGVPVSPVKIGIAERPLRRLAGLQTGCPFALMLHETWKLGDISAGTESDIHEMFAHNRLHGEWFDVEPETARRLIEGAFYLKLAIAGEAELAKKIGNFGSRARSGELPDWRQCAG